MTKIQIEAHHYKRAVECFYEGILNPERWIEGLRLLTLIAKSKMAFILVWDQLSGHVRFNEYLGMPGESFNEYTSCHYQFDPSKEFVDRLRLGSWHISRLNTNDHILHRSRHYQSVLKCHDICVTATNKLIHENGLHGFLVIPRLVGEESFTYTYIQRLKNLLLHLQRALRLRLKVQSLTMQASHSAAVLDCIHLPLCVVDETGVVQLSNQHMETFIRRHPCLSICNGILAAHGKDNECLLGLFRRACDLNGTPTAGGCHLAKQKQSPVQVIVTPLPPKLTLHNSFSTGMALAILYDGSSTEKSKELLLRQIFLLTPTEERICRSLLSRATPEEVAEELHVSIATLRTHLRSIFRKMGTRRQADLIQILCVHLFT